MEQQCYPSPRQQNAPCPKKWHQAVCFGKRRRHHHATTHAPRFKAHSATRNSARHSTCTRINVARPEGAKTGAASAHYPTTENSPAPGQRPIPPAHTCHPHILPDARSSCRQVASACFDSMEESLGSTKLALSHRFDAVPDKRINGRAWLRTTPSGKSASYVILTKNLHCCNPSQLTCSGAGTKVNEMLLSRH